MPPYLMRCLSVYTNTPTHTPCLLAAEQAVVFTASPRAAPAWWGRLPWEDVVVGALLSGRVALIDHPGFSHPFMACHADTVVSPSC